MNNDAQTNIGLLINCLFGSSARILVFCFGLSMVIDSVTRGISEEKENWPSAVVSIFSDIKDAWIESTNDDYETMIDTLQSEKATLAIQNERLESSLKLIEDKLLKIDKLHRNELDASTKS